MGLRRCDVFHAVLRREAGERSAPVPVPRACVFLTPVSTHSNSDGDADMDDMDARRDSINDLSILLVVHGRGATVRWVMEVDDRVGWL